MKPVVRHIARISGLAVFCMYMVVTIAASSVQRSSRTCTGLDIVITDSSENCFVTGNDIRQFIAREYGKYEGVCLDSINLVKIENIIDGRSAVRKCEAYVTGDGKLNLRVSQRKPVIRFQKNDGGFYADEDGFLFPLQRNYTSLVPIIDGNIPLKANSGYKGKVEDEKELKWLKKMMSLVDYMNGSVWKRNIVQISIDRDGDIIMVPREGKEKFIFGQPDRIKEKFELMELYYTSVLPEKGEDYYSTVNVKYENQLICRK